MLNRILMPPDSTDILFLTEGFTLYLPMVFRFGYFYHSKCVVCYLEIFISYNDIYERHKHNPAPIKSFHQGGLKGVAWPHAGIELDPDPFSGSNPSRVGAM